MSSRRFISGLLVGLLALLGPIIAWCCGPFFPNTMLEDRERELLRSPMGDMGIEFNRIAPATAVPFKAKSARPVYDWMPTSQPADTAAADLAELKAALTAQAIAPAQRDKILAQYDEFRDKLTIFADRRLEANRRWVGDIDLELDLPGEPVAKRQWNAEKKAIEKVKANLPVLGEVTVPPGLPGEFEDYARGAVAYDQGKIDQARKAWAGLLERPATERHYRSVWAAYMLARTYVKADSAKCVEWCVKAQEFAKAGFADSTGLAAASLGLAGRAELNSKHYDRAMEFYLEQLSAGEPSAPMSLREVVWEILRDDGAALKKVAADPKTRQVIAAFMVCRGGPYTPFDTKDKKKLAWLEAVEAADIKNMDSADRLAWAAYTLGQPKIAQRWIDRAKADSPITQWVQAKLLLRAGKIDEAAGLLAKASKAFPKDQRWQSHSFSEGRRTEVEDRLPTEVVAGELAILRLARRQYVDSLDLLLRNGWWTDAAYVAERVLTVDELQKYVDANWPAKLAESYKPKGGPKAGLMYWFVGGWGSPIWSSETPDASKEYVAEAEKEREAESACRACAIRWLLARRLTRVGQGREARPYFPPEWRDKLDDYLASLKVGHDPKQPDAKRIDALWHAGKLARFSGMELMGAELGPDGFIYGGTFPVHAARAANPADKQTVIPVPLRGKDEARRYQSSAVAPDQRFHYRYIAADLAWEAAHLLPRRSIKRNPILTDGYNWLINTDPKAAERFGKALLRQDEE